jgi:hypothetical protein
VITVFITVLVTIPVLIFIFILVFVAVAIMLIIIEYSMSSGFLRMAHDPAQASEKTNTQYSGKWY